MARNEVSTLRVKAAEYKASIIASNAFPVGASNKIRQVSASMLRWSRLYIYGEFLKLKRIIYKKEGSPLREDLSFLINFQQGFSPRYNDMQ